MRHPTGCLHPTHESQPGPPGAYLHNKTRSCSSPLSISRPSLCGLIKRSRPPLDLPHPISHQNNKHKHKQLSPHPHPSPLTLHLVLNSSHKPPECLSPPLLPHPLVKSACVGSQRSVKMWRMSQSSDWQGLCGVTSPSTPCHDEALPCFAMGTLPVTVVICAISYMGVGRLE
jgi:hypothetical protein